ncbi:MAG: YbaB/EbfC family nucleoid-associated protein [Bacillota bacterium]|nr:YbaB/EbfC family nucleoid-associated protein [Bacillota bacterium]
MLGGLGGLFGNLETVKKALADIVVEAGNEYAQVTVNGLQKVLKVRLGPFQPANVAQLEAALASCFDEAMALARLRAKDELERILGFKVPEMP